MKIQYDVARIALKRGGLKMFMLRPIGPSTIFKGIAAMLTISLYRDDAGGSHLQVTGYFEHSKTIEIQFKFWAKVNERVAVREIDEILLAGGHDWLRHHGDLWEVNADILRRHIDPHHGFAWFRGRIVLRLVCESSEILPPMRMGFDNRILPPEPSLYKRYETLATLTIDEELVSEQLPRKIFLSHKSLDKSMVRRYSNVLIQAGFEVWLDEEAMPAGTPLERGLLAGFKDSCAAVFFITPNYKDEGFLETEINYALSEKREKGSRFSIIALVIRGEDGTQGEVPLPLTQCVFKTVEHELDGLAEILRALPIKLGPANWK